MENLNPNNNVQPVQPETAPSQAQQPQAVNPQPVTPVTQVPVNPVQPVPVAPVVPTQGQQPQQAVEMVNGKIVPRKKKGPQLGLGCLVFAVVFFVILVLAFVSILVFGGNESTLFGASGASLVAYLKAGTTALFAILSLGLLILTVILAFKRTVIPVADKEARKKSLKNVAISGVLFFVSLFTWLFVYVLLLSINVESGAVQMITTNPTSTTQLTGPIDITFYTDAVQSDVASRKLSIAQCNWDFDGDKKVDETGCQLTHTFSKVGTFTVTLEVQLLSNGQTLDEKEYYYTTVSVENLKPTVNLNLSASSGVAPLTVDFDASSSYDPDNAVNNLTYEWVFEEGGETTSGVDTTSHIYTEPGDYVMTLKVTDNKGATTEVTKKIKVEETDATSLSAEISTTPTELKGQVPFAVRFDATSSSSPYGDISAYIWDFGDGSSGKRGRTVTYTFNKGGEYVVTLTIEDEKGNRAQKQVTVTVGNPAVVPTAVITSDQTLLKDSTRSYITGVVPFAVNFSGKTSTDGDNNIVDYLWDFNGDGTYTDGEGDTITWIFEEEGTFQVGLKVIDKDNQESETTLEVRVEEDKVRPVVTTDPDPATGTAPFTISFDASGSTYEDGDILSYEWDFDDGTQAVMGDAQVTHVFKLVGEYEVRMTIYTDDNKKATYTKKVVVRNVALKAKIVPSILHGPAPLSVMFDSSESTGSIQSYAWDFGDGETSTQARPTHTYTKSGTYEVKLTIMDNTNNLSSTTQTILVETAD